MHGRSHHVHYGDVVLTLRYGSLDNIGIFSTRGQRKWIVHTTTVINPLTVDYYFSLWVHDYETGPVFLKPYKRKMIGDLSHCFRF